MTIRLQEKRPKSSRRQAGFSLVEIVVVLFIISLGLVGILSLIIQNIQSQSYNKSQLVANQLAQEGIELIRRVRDVNWRNGQPYNLNLAEGIYVMDYDDLLPVGAAAAPGQMSRLFFDDNGFYYHQSGASETPVPETGFSRLITIQPLVGSAFIVRSRVSWEERGRNFRYELETILYDWK